MSTQSLHDIAEILLAAAQRHGATAADVVVAEGDSLDVGVRLQEIEKLKQARQKHLGLRAFVGARSAVTSTADFSRDALERLAADTCALARVVAPDPVSGLPTAAELATTQPDLDLYDPDVAALTAEDAIARATAAERAALDTDPRITNSEGAECSASARQIVYASSLGFRGTYRDSGVSLSAVPVAVVDGAMQRDYWYSAQRKLARLDTAEHIGRTAAQRALRRLRARRVPTGEVPVVFDPETAGSLLRHLAAAVSGYSLYKGSSFLIGKLGERIAPDGVTIVDDGTVPGALGSKPFDGEGVADAPHRRGRSRRADQLPLRHLLGPQAGQLHHRQCGPLGRRAAQVAPTNFFLQAGTASPQEIIASVKSGLYVTELIGFGVNPTTGDYSRGAVGLWIENGELTHAVEEITIAGHLLAMYADIEAVGNDLEMRHSVAAPTVKIARMIVAGQ